MSEWSVPAPQLDPTIFEPSLESRASNHSGARPWRIPSLFWVAFLGGVGPYVVLALINARRLRATRECAVLVAGLRLIGLAATKSVILRLALEHATERVDGLVHAAGLTWPSHPKCVRETGPSSNPTTHPG